jgi:hypothetical protein
MKPLNEMTKDDLISTIQDYQELVSGLEALVNAALTEGTQIHPLVVRRLLELHVYQVPLGRDDFLCDGSP